MKNSYKLLYVEWEDSFGGRGGWQSPDLEDLPDTSRVYSVGWLVGEHDRSIVLMANFSEETEHAHFQVCGMITIPRSAVLRARELPGLLESPVYLVSEKDSEKSRTEAFLNEVSKQLEEDPNE